MITWPSSWPLTYFRKTLTWLLFFYCKRQCYHIWHMSYINKTFMLWSLIWNTWPFDLYFQTCQLLMTAMNAKATLLVLCHLHLSRQHIMITSVSYSLLTSLSSLSKGNSVKGNMCSSFTPCYFAIIHIKYHIKMSPLVPHAFLWMLPIFYACCVNLVPLHWLI